MKNAVRIDLAGTFMLPIPSPEAFPLLTPLGEVGWVPEWEPTFVHPTAGELELDQVSVTAVGGETTLWTVTALDPRVQAIEDLRVTPGSRLARVTVRVSSDDEGSRVHVRYRCTALSGQGRKELASFARGFDFMAGGV